MTQPSAKIILDSINDQGHRLTTMEVVFHRFILAEMNTHRVFSRNSASSRAIPVDKIMARVEADPAYPVIWPTEKKGMQGGEPIKDPDKHKALWGAAADRAIVFARRLIDVNLHKSLVNRLMEPFMWHTAIITSTEWDNFFHQRCDPAAQPEMQAVADEMQRAYYTSTPKLLTHGEWHMPYIVGKDWDDARSYTIPLSPSAQFDLLKKVSTARCARVSYLTHDGSRDLGKDLELFDKLKGSGHWSPFEHVATPVAGDGSVTGNFQGWKQFRKEFREENRTRFIPNLPDLAHIAEQMKEKNNDK